MISALEARKLTQYSQQLRMREIYEAIRTAATEGRGQVTIPYQLHEQQRAELEGLGYNVSNNYIQW